MLTPFVGPLLLLAWEGIRWVSLSHFYLCVCCCFLHSVFEMIHLVYRIPVWRHWGGIMGIREIMLEKSVFPHILCGIVAPITHWVYSWLANMSLVRFHWGLSSVNSLFRIPWIEEPGGLQSMGSQRVRHDWPTKSFNFT